MSSSKSHFSLPYRLVFYLGGFLFATISYILGLWVFGAESASWGDAELHNNLLANLSESFESHYISFFLWQAVCVSIAGVFGHLLDEEVSLRRKAELRANIDGVTEIFNHRYFQERLTSEIERASRYSRTLSLIMLDLDDFKMFNDTWGHQEGDMLLKWFAEVCTSNIRSIDLLARYGGEEFVIILPETSSREAMEVSERIRAAIESQSASAFGENKRITVSAGVACYPEHGNKHHSLILNADAALYAAKRRGKNRCYLYEDNCHLSYRVASDHIKALLCDDDMEAIKALAMAADAGDSYAKGHSISVMNYALKIGKGMRLSAEEMGNLRAAALLHDLGRLDTPGAILTKQEPLEEEEWKRIEEHAKIGSRILKRLQQLSAIIPGVKHHHERFDGKGYPNGLAGKNIPLLARIIAIADAYDAMTNARSYRKAFTVHEAIEELRHGSGTQFDPEIVDIFIKTITSRHRNEAA